MSFSPAPINVHITTESPNGSTYLPLTPPPTQASNPAHRMTYIYSSPPNLDLSSSNDLNHHQAAVTQTPLPSFPDAGGSTSMVIDFGPAVDDTPGAMHRSHTLDYVFVVDGELELLLDSGEKRTLRKGDVVIQRGAMHSWRNLSKTNGGRMIAVALGDKGAKAGDMEFPEKK